jgi:transcription initiation factor TFIID TATA-box-binding protein
MEDIDIENIVAITQIANKLNIKQLEEKIPELKFNPEEFEGLVLHFESPKTAALLFSSGKIVCTGAKQENEVIETMKLVIEKLKSVGVKVNENPKVKIQNIVASIDLEKEFQLSSVAKSLSLENVEYDPEKFPGLVYKLENPNLVLLLFSSGKVVCTGGKRLKETFDAIDTFKDKLSSLGS